MEVEVNTSGKKNLEEEVAVEQMNECAKNNVNELEEGFNASGNEEAMIWDHQFAKAVKDDDAEVPIHFWDNRVWELQHNAICRRSMHQRVGCCPLTFIRRLALHRWHKNLLRSLLSYLRSTYGTDWWIVREEECKRDVEAGAECISHGMAADW